MDGGVGDQMQPNPNTTQLDPCQVYLDCVSKRSGSGLIMNINHLSRLGSSSSSYVMSSLSLGPKMYPNPNLNATVGTHKLNVPRGEQKAFDQVFRHMVNKGRINLDANQMQAISNFVSYPIKNHQIDN